MDTSPLTPKELVLIEEAEKLPTLTNLHVTSFVIIKLLICILRRIATGKN